MSPLQQLGYPLKNSVVFKCVSCVLSIIDIDKFLSYSQTGKAHRGVCNFAFKTAMGGKKNKNKACKNAFFFFMMELKQRQGFNFRNMEEVSQAASPLWNVS